MSKEIIRIGSRESALAVIQSELAIKEIQRVLPEAETVLVTMKTTGDRILNRPLDQIGGKGLFVKELDQALLDGRCDLTVHSLKDMPMEQPQGLPILAYLKREDPRDVLVLRRGLSALPPCPVIGTSSKRRALQAKRLFPGAVFEGCRGNLVTRMKKLDDGAYDALILAAAGMLRLGYGERISRYFTVQEMIPAAGQGILAIQGRSGEGQACLSQIDDPEARILALAERAFVRTLDGGCTSPTAASAALEDGRLTVTGLYCGEETGDCRIGRLEGLPEEAESLGERLALMLKKGEGTR